MDFARHLADLIRHEGPMRLDRFMGLANAHYYATRDPLGVAGDFITAPEISQLFGELIGLCLVDIWERSGAPSPIRLVELGPGRGTLMADLLRAARVRPAFLTAARLSLVETSPALRTRQRETLKDHDIEWMDSLDVVPNDAPLYLVANEFFDALPIRQFVRAESGWLERFVGIGESGALTFAARPAPRHPALQLSDAACEAGAVAEVSEATLAVAADIGTRLRAHGGAAIVIDYGHLATAAGDTLQAVKRHGFADILQTAGSGDLTAHVDFAALAAAAAVPAVATTQGTFLKALGIDTRAAVLSRGSLGKAADIAAAVERLTSSGQMGTLFKAMALTGPGAPVPAGFPP